MGSLFSLTSSAGQRATRRRSKPRSGGTLRDEIIATVSKQEFYRRWPWLGEGYHTGRTDGEERRDTQPNRRDSTDVLSIVCVKNMTAKQSADVCHETHVRAFVEYFSSFIIFRFHLLAVATP